MEPKITLMVHTASCDNFLQNQGIDSYFQAVTDNLRYQTFKDFEFIYIDTFLNDNKEVFSKLTADLPFLVKHVGVHPNHRYWYDRGNIYIGAAKNTGILYADGELLITCDDSEFFPDNLLQKYWSYYKSGGLMHAFHKRMRSIGTSAGKILNPVQGDIYVNDNRLGTTKDLEYHNIGGWLYAGTSFTLEDALIINGFNEKMDGYKNFEDCDFGVRMQMLGRTFVLDKLEGFLYILDHGCYLDHTSKKSIKNFIAVDNYGVLQVARELFEIKANTTTPNEKFMKIVQRETMEFKGFDPLAEANREKLEIWLGTPNFDLTKERRELRSSSEWKW